MEKPIHIADAVENVKREEKETMKTCTTDCIFCLGLNEMKNYNVRINPHLKIRICGKLVETQSIYETRKGRFLAHRKIGNEENGVLVNTLNEAKEWLVRTS